MRGGDDAEDAKAGEDEFLPGAGPAPRGEGPRGPGGHVAAGAARPRCRGVPRPTAKGGEPMSPRPGGSGTVYRPTGRDGQPTRWYWLRYRAPGEKGMRRELTDPRTDDEGEARRQLYARLGERPWVRLQRERMEDLRVERLLALYVADCSDHHQS